MVPSLAWIERLPMWIVAAEGRHLSFRGGERRQVRSSRIGRASAAEDCAVLGTRSATRAKLLSCITRCWNFQARGAGGANAMSFFSKLKAAFSGSAELPTTVAPTSVEHGLSWRKVLTEIGVAAPTCPYCGHAFEKMPQRKRSCPKCSGVLYSRKRAIDGAKVLLTDAQARDGEAQHALVALSEEGVSDADIDALVGALQAQFGRVPMADEVVTEYFARSAAAHAEAWDWGLYRNARFNLAEACARRGLHEDALRLFLEVSLIDLNGPRNCGTKDPEILRDFPPFDPKTAFLAPGVINRTVDVIAELKFSPADTRRAFESVASSVGPALSLPGAPTTAWRELSKALAQAQG